MSYRGLRSGGGGGNFGSGGLVRVLVVPVADETVNHGLAGFIIMMIII